MARRPDYLMGFPDGSTLSARSPSELLLKIGSEGIHKSRCLIEIKQGLAQRMKVWMNVDLNPMLDDGKFVEQLSSIGGLPVVVLSFDDDDD